MGAGKTLNIEPRLLPASVNAANVVSVAQTRVAGQFVMWNGSKYVLATPPSSASASPSAVSDGDKGDITVSGSGSSWAIDADVVTYDKMQNITDASRLLGRGDSGSGDPQEITLGTGLSMSGTTLSSSGSGLTYSQAFSIAMMQ